MKIDFHVHTSESSCSNMTLYDAVETAVSKGLDGIAICNHNKPFYVTDIPSDLEERLNVTVNPTSVCDNAFYIISGVEESNVHGHFLKLFIDDDNSAVKVLAHPFEQVLEYKARSLELANLRCDFDIVEAHSGRANYKNKRACDMALEFCREYSITQCAGSDAHFKNEIGNAWCEFSDDVIGLEEIREKLLKNDCTFYYSNSKRINVAKSQIIKNPGIKSLAFWCYCLIRDIGDKLCQR